jgi:hypothetical protein
VSEHEHQEMSETFEQVARHLSILTGGDWSWRPNPPGWAVGGHLDDSSSPGMQLYAHLSSKKAGTINISGSSPKDSRGQVPYILSRAKAEINVSSAKSPQTIAGDIQRRLLPEWQPQLAKGLEAIGLSNASEDATTRNIAEIVKITGGKVRDHRVSFYGSPHAIFAERSSSADVGDDYVRLELELSPEDAFTLLRFMTK